MTISLEISMKKLVRLTAQTLRGKSRMEFFVWVVVVGVFGIFALFGFV